VRPSIRSLAPAAWLRLPQRTARMRLSLLYAREVVIAAGPPE